ncbi:putative defensin-like protein 162 [Capsella rubella]|uniref:putative defensin-like protein 162 n=1 Tax=Capsella rubella TaxID=81985 RepID=UPI000CD4F9F2|nr:putative defensin-like protein 162 [Capsella rubella]
MFVLSAFLALSSAEEMYIKRCVVEVKLSKPCTYHECQPLCLMRYKGNGVCPGKNNICACVFYC